MGKHCKSKVDMPWPLTEHLGAKSTREQQTRRCAEDCGLQHPPRKVHHIPNIHPTCPSHTLPRSPRESLPKGQPVKTAESSWNRFLPVSGLPSLARKPVEDRVVVVEVLLLRVVQPARVRRDGTLWLAGPGSVGFAPASLLLL